MIKLIVTIDVPDDFYIDDIAGIEEAICDAMADLHGDANEQGKYNACVNGYTAKDGE